MCTVIIGSARERVKELYPMMGVVKEKLYPMMGVVKGGALSYDGRG